MVLLIYFTNGKVRLVIIILKLIINKLEKIQKYDTVTFNIYVILQTKKLK